MSANPSERKGILRVGGIDLSESIASPTSIHPSLSAHRRAGYRRMDSQGSVQFSPDIQTSETASHSHFRIPSITRDDSSISADAPHGLGISRIPSTGHNIPSPPSPASAFQSPAIGSVVSPSTSQQALLSPTWTQDGLYGDGGLGQGHSRNESWDEEDISRGRISAFTESLDHAFANGNGEYQDLSRLNSLRNNSNDGKHGHLHSGCAANDDIHSHTTSWLSVSMLFLCIYSTVFSGLFFFVAVIKPRYRAIYTGGSFSPSTASIVFTIFAKSIELSFVTIFVTFLGQVLSRRSLVKTSDGVTVAELTMRTWVNQPGFMITKPKIVARAVLTFLGAMTLIAAWVAMLYTTASDALVNPSLQFGKWEPKVMQGLVQTKYANQAFVESNCQSPVTVGMDPLFKNSTCVDLDHAGEAYHNFLEYLHTWAAISAAGGAGVSSDLAKRPNVTAMLYDNTTVTAAWVATNTSNITAHYEKYNRIVNNVTVAMPHANVVAASHDSNNGIFQPAELGGVGEYIVRASVVSPTINVLCVNMNATELSPLIYVDFPDAKTNMSNVIPNQKLAWSGWQDDVQVKPGQKYLNSTVADEIFGWGANGVQPPVFPMRPMNYNIISNISVLAYNNITGDYDYSPYIYLLVKSNFTTDYTVCQMSSYLSTDCSTLYSASGTGGVLSSTCEDPYDKMAYSKSVKPRPTSLNSDFRGILSEWSLSMSLNTGSSSDNASTNRILSQFVSLPTPKELPKLNSTLPSLAEALASLSGCTLLIAAQDATFHQQWDHDTDTLSAPGRYEPFNATISSQEYTSGPQQPWQYVFYLVLILVFIINIFCLGYFIRQRGLVTDFTETQNLFALAVNSPPSQRLGGSCGAGPQGDQLSVDFHVHHEENSSHFYLKEGNGVYESTSFELKDRGDPQALKSRTASSYSMLSNKRRSRL